jgi:hypothetical protein
MPGFYPGSDIVNSGGRGWALKLILNILRWFYEQPGDEPLT